MASLSIYLDVCCFNRPFDDQRQQRIRLETEAILLILEGCQQAKYELLSSDAVVAEIERTSDLERRARLQALANTATTRIVVDAIVEQRGAKLMEQGFTVFDALHVASAEAGQADFFVTTDDRLLRRAVRLQEVLQVKVVNPVNLLLEVTNDSAE